ncbi:MAG TPA: cell division ATP-binding protein FtsE [Erysipelothrix sp.]|jgi:cell division transport system ATP-binding protein|nr:cell division ATP-binding protein FtsE [Erysipelothrix sp.]
MIVMRNIYKQYPNGTNALYDLNLSVNRGEFIYVIGETGSGKSTLIKLLDAEEKPTSGTVKVSDIDVGRLKRRKIPYFRRHVGVVYQDFKLLPKKTVFENVSFALEALNMPHQQIRKRVREVLALVDLSEKASSFPTQLSGGQQQRVAIARAIANRPFILIADEPTGNLDPERAKGIIELLEQINEAENTTVIMVTHNEQLVNQYKKRTIVLSDGHVVADLNVGGYINEADF